jgi:hypothetical protein
MRDQAMHAQEGYEADLDRLWAVIQRASPERKEEIISKLDEKTVTALRTKNNPYGKPVFKGNSNKLLAFQVINLTEKYLERFAMTSFIGFIYRMLDEYEPEAAKRYPSEHDPEFGNIYVKMVANLKRDKPAARYRARATEIATRIAEIRADTPETPEMKKDLRDLVKESFQVRTCLHKYELSLLRDERKETKEKAKLLNAEIQNIDRSIDVATKRIPDVEKAIGLRESYDKSLEDLRKKITAEDPEKKMTTNDRVEIAKKLGFTLEQAESRTVDSYKREISDKKALIERNTKTLVEKREEHEHMQAEIDEFTKQMEKLNDALNKLKEEYSKKFKTATSKPSKPAPKGRGKARGPVKSKGRTVETVHPLDTIEPEEYEPTDEDIDEINESVKKQLGIDRTREEHTEYMQDIVQDFLDQYLVFNPDTHVQCAYKPNYEDPLRTPLQIDEHRRVTEKEYERSLLPPDDTFFRWKRYQENNYEELRQATDDIYCEKSDFEFDIVPLEVFEGPNAEEEAQAFDRKYADEVEADILRATFGVHNLMGSWAQNREKRDFYNENSEILKRIINENEESQKFGKKLNKQRAEKKKEENVRETGPHAASFESYKNNNPSAMREHGAVEASDIPTHDIIPKDTGKLGKDEVEVGVSVIRPVKRRGGRRGYRGTTDQYKFHIPEEELKPENVSVKLPSQVHKELEKDEKAARKAKKAKKAQKNNE